MNSFLYRIIIITLSCYCVSTFVAYAEQITTTVTPSSGRACIAYLNIPQAGTSTPLVVLQEGTGIYSTAHFENILGGLYETDRVSLLTIDKPGIRYDENLPHNVFVDTKIYNHYTQADLRDCLEEAITWALDDQRVSPRIIFIGHSEGTSVMGRLYYKLLKDNPNIAEKVTAIIMSGVNLDSLKNSLEYQIGTNGYEHILSYVQRKDDKTLRILGDVGLSWFQEGFRLRPLSYVLRQVAKLHPQAVFKFFQGTKDHLTSPDSVRAFELYNKRQLSLKKSALDLEVKYYASGHSLNKIANDDILNAIEKLVR